MSTDLWSGRAALYVDSDAHREGADLDTLVEWCKGSRTALDVATGGGHVARRLREGGLEVVTADPAAGMRPDVICAAESLPFADRSFDAVVCRTAAHHFADVRAAVREMARVSGDLVLLVDTVAMGDDVEQAERLRDPSHVRNYSEGEWREIIAGAGLSLDDLQLSEHEMDFAAWLARTGCAGDEAEHVTRLLGARVRAGRLSLAKIAIRARASA